MLRRCQIASKASRERTTNIESAFKIPSKMSMIPFFPTLKVSVANRYWLDMAPASVNEESQTRRYEDERSNWVSSLQTPLSV